MNYYLLITIYQLNFLESIKVGNSHCLLILFCFVLVLPYRQRQQVAWHRWYCACPVFPVAAIFFSPSFCFLNIMSTWMLALKHNKMSSHFQILFTLFCVLISTTSGLYFHIGETEKKCFIEELPDETMVVGK